MTLFARLLKHKAAISITAISVTIAISFQNCSKVSFKAVDTNGSASSSSVGSNSTSVSCKFNGVTYPAGAKVISYKLDSASSQALCDASSNKITSECFAPGNWEPPVNAFTSCRVTSATGDNCTAGDSISCVLDNGRGKKVCGTDKIWGVCTPVQCNSGYSVNTAQGKCIPATCTPGSEVACNRTTSDSTVISIGTGICASSGYGVVTCTDVKCIEPAQNFAGTTPPVCSLSCSPNSQRSCHDRNGFGTQSCLASGSAYSSCVLNMCDDGFTFDATTKSCIAQSCTAGSTKSCTTQDGVAGVYKCAADNHYSTVCEPVSCPSGFDAVKVDGNTICQIKLCQTGYTRNSNGVCVITPATSPTPVTNASPSTTTSPTPNSSPSASLKCDVNGAKVSDGSFEVFSGYKTANVPFGTNCVSDNYVGICDGKTGIATYSKQAGSATCSVAAAINCKVNDNPVPPGPFTINSGYKAATVPYGQQCVTDTYSGTCDGATGLAALTKVAASTTCSVGGIKSCTVDGQAVPAGNFSIPSGYTTSSVPYGANCVADTKAGTCDGVTGQANVTKNPVSATCSPAAAKTCIVNGNTVAAGPFDLMIGYKASSVPAGQSCVKDNYSGNCDGATGQATYTKQAAAASCSVASSLNCTVNNQSVPPGPFIVQGGFKDASAKYGTSCVPDNFTGTCDGTTGVPTISKYPASMSCSVAAGVNCNVNGRTVPPGAFNENTGYTSASVPYGSSCVKDNYTGTCDGATGEALYTKQAGSASCSVQGAKSCMVNGTSVPAGTFDVPYGYKSSSVPYGSTCEKDNYVGTCDGATGSPSFSKQAGAAACSVQTAKTCNVNGQTVAGGNFNVPGGYKTDWVPAISSCDLNRSAYIGTCDPATGVPSYTSTPPYNTCAMELAPSCSFTTTQTNLLLGEVMGVSVKSNNAYGIEYSTDGNVWIRPSTPTSNLPMETSFMVTMASTGSKSFVVRALSRSGIPTNCTAGLLASVPLNVMSGKVSLNTAGTTTASFAQNQALNVLVESSSNVEAVQVDCGSGWNSYNTKNGTQTFPAGTFAVGSQTCKNRIVVGSFIREINSVTLNVSGASCTGTKPADETVLCSTMISGGIDPAATVSVGTYVCTKDSAAWTLVSALPADPNKCATKCLPDYEWDGTLRTCKPKLLRYTIQLNNESMCTDHSLNLRVYHRDPYGSGSKDITLEIIGQNPGQNAAQDYNCTPSDLSSWLQPSGGGYSSFILPPTINKGVVGNLDQITNMYTTSTSYMSIPRYYNYTYYDYESGTYSDPSYLMEAGGCQNGGQSMYSVPITATGPLNKYIGTPIALNICPDPYGGYVKFSTTIVIEGYRDGSTPSYALPKTTKPPIYCLAATGYPTQCP